MYGHLSGPGRSSGPETPVLPLTAARAAQLAGAAPAGGGAPRRSRGLRGGSSCRQQAGRGWDRDGVRQRRTGKTSLRLRGGQVTAVGGEGRYGKQFVGEACGR